MYGEGEWKAKKHGASKRRKWLKLHLTVDLTTQEIIQLELSNVATEPAHSVGAEIIQSLPKWTQVVIGDGGYDTRRCRKAVEAIEAHELIPPRKNARLTKDLKNRNEELLEIKGFRGDEVAKGILGEALQATQLEPL